MYPGTSQRFRGHYESALLYCLRMHLQGVLILPTRSRRPWSLAILFFLFIILATATSPFALGRLVDIDTRAEVRILGCFIFQCILTNLRRSVASAEEIF